MDENYLKRFSNLTFEDFRRLATDSSLSKYEKIGFPNNYRSGKEELIFSDILQKVEHLQNKNKVVLDIGPGCSDLPLMIADHCEAQGHQLLLVDSEEMLAHLPDGPYVLKYPGFFPCCDQLMQDFVGKVDVIIAYSVLHYVFDGANFWNFLDSALSLLAEGGRMLIGDIPNISKRRRFFASHTGKRFHREFTGKNDDPLVQFNSMASGQIDDGVIFGMLMRARAAGFDAYVLPQSRDLSMANRREDILICRP